MMFKKRLTGICLLTSMVFALPGCGGGGGSDGGSSTSSTSSSGNSATEPLLAVAPIVSAPLPTIEPIFIAPLPAVAPVANPPANMGNTVNKNNTVNTANTANTNNMASMVSQSVPALKPTPPLPPSQRVSTPPLQNAQSVVNLASVSQNNVRKGGFHNFRSTCAANSYLKFLINSVGGSELKKYLIDGFDNYSSIDSGYEKKNASQEDLNNFVSLIDSLDNSPDASKNELSSFFKGFGQILRFNGVGFLSSAENVHWFSGLMDDFFKVDGLLHNEISFGSSNDIRYVSYFNADAFEGYALQDIVNDSFLKACRGDASCKNYVDDSDGFNSFYVKIAPKYYSQVKSNIDFDAEVDVVVGTGSQQGVVLKFQAADVVMRTGEGEKKGHYIAYHRGDDGKWVEHNDEMVKSDNVDFLGVPQIIRFVKK